MVDSRRRAKLVDFGLAKFLEQRERAELAMTRAPETVVGTVAGTFMYMSPEQIRGRTLDARTDLFSLGVVLYEMLAGRLPFDGATLTDVADGILNAEPPALARFNYAIPSGARRDCPQGHEQGRGAALSVGARAAHRPSARRA